MFTCTTNSPEETAHLAELVGQKIREGTVLCLEGDLGAGKTLFVQSLAHTLGVEGEVTSPTFNLMNVYEGICPIYHFDLYRLETTEDPEGIVVIEWSDKFPQCMPEERVVVRIEKSDDGDGRHITFASVGERYQEFIKELESFVYLSH